MAKIKIELPDDLYEAVHNDARATTLSDDAVLETIISKWYSDLRAAVKAERGQKVQPAPIPFNAISYILDNILWDYNSPLGEAASIARSWLLKQPTKEKTEAT